MTRRRLVRVSGLAMAVTFALVGAVFLLAPGGVLAAFNWAGRALQLPESPTDAFTLYLALAVAYMYVVTVLALQMARHPDVRVYPWLLVQAKMASALVCLGLFAFQEQQLIYFANFAVDGTIAALVWWIALRHAPEAEPATAESPRESRGRETAAAAPEQPR